VAVQVLRAEHQFEGWAHGLGFHGSGDLGDVGALVKVKIWTWQKTFMVKLLFYRWGRTQAICLEGRRFTAFCSLHATVACLSCNMVLAAHYNCPAGCPASQTVICSWSAIWAMCPALHSSLNEHSFCYPYLIAWVGTSNLTDYFWPPDGIWSEPVSNYKSHRLSFQVS
jgi:hypothetical protein